MSDVGNLYSSEDRGDTENIADETETEWDEDVWGSARDSSMDERSRLLEAEADGIFKPGAKRNVLTYEEALHACGFGKFHIILLLMCGWAVSSDAIEVLAVSFVLPSATCDLSMTSSDKGWLNSIVFLGMMVGGYFWGSLADKGGRRSILLWSLLVNGIGNLASSVSQVFWLFLICRFISGIGVGGSMPVIFTYYTEFQHKSRRGAMISVLATFWMAGNIVAAGLAWVVIPREYLSFVSGDFTFHSWRVFVALCSLPSISSAAMFVLMPESPKYLLQRGREEDAISVIHQVHASNKSKVPLMMEGLVLTDEDVDAYIKERTDIIKKTSLHFWRRFKKGLSSLLDASVQLFRPPLRRPTLLLLIINFTLAFGYYGLFLWFPELFSRIDKYGGSFCDVQVGNGTNNQTVCETPGSAVFLESFLTSISNLPGNILSVLIVEKVGRKRILAVSMVLSGVSVFFLWFVKTKWQNVLMSCIFGAISVCGFNMLDVLQAELFPTGVRSTACGVQAAALRVGAILGNIIFGQLIDVYCAVPMLMVAVLLAFGGLASLWLPNTTGIDIH